MTEHIKIKDGESLIIDVSCGCSYSLNQQHVFFIIGNCPKHEQGNEEDNSLTAFNNAIFEELKPTLKTNGLTKEEREKELNKIKQTMKQGLKQLEILGEPITEQKELCPYCKSDKLELGKIKPKLYKCISCKREMMKPLTIGGKADIENLFKF